MKLETVSDEALVLVVDDQIENLQIVGNILSQRRLRKAVTTNGMEAIEIAHRKQPDVILLDIMMPEMDGYEVCRRLKENDETKDIPIIFLTAKSLTDDILKGFEFGGVDYITKPFKQDELMARIETQIELKRSKDTIMRQNEKLKRLYEEKVEIFNIAAHDLKNPLAVVVAYAKMLEEQTGRLQKKQIKEIANDIKYSGDNMFRIISDLLIINSAEEGKLELNYETFDVNDIIERLVENWNVAAKAKKISVEFNRTNQALKAELDAGKFYDILENLISNAVKFSPHQSNVFVNSYLAKNLDNHNTLIVEVRDEGPGIDSEDMSKLFQKFARLKTKPTNNESSTRLGLSIVKKFVEMMNGRVWCESGNGTGSTFKFELPLKKNY